MTTRRITTLPPLRRLLAGFVLLCLAAGGLVPPAALFLWGIPAALVAAVVAADTIRGLARGELGVDLIALLAIVAALLLGEFLTAAVIALMVAGGGALEKYAAARARRELTALLARTPPAWRIAATAPRSSTSRSTPPPPAICCWSSRVRRCRSTASWPSNPRRSMNPP